METDTRALVEEDAAGDTEADGTPWSPAKKLGFRLLAAYFVLYTLPFPLDRVPGIGGFLSRIVDGLWRAAGPWVGAHVLGIDGEMFLGPTGSGDTTFDYVRLLMMVALTPVLAGIWTLLDRGRRDYDTAARWLVVGCRFYLGMVMLNYGIAKVIPTQFSSPGLTRLLTPYGESSPMGIVWTFMGASVPYTIFAGLGETLGGALLLFRRTRALGAAVVIAVMSNVVMINYAYDVPVKLYSTHLLLMAVALLALDARRLLDFFWYNRPVAPAPRPPLLASRRARIAATVAAVLLVATVVVGNVDRGLQVYSSFGNGRPRPSLWGIHDVESFVLDGVERPPLLTDEVRWRALIVDRALPMTFGTTTNPGFVSVWHMDGSFTNHRVELDEEAHTLTFLPRPQSDEGASGDGAGAADRPAADVLRWERPAPGRLMLRGTWQGLPLEAELVERDLSQMELIGRGFHWINETPYNR